MDFGGSPGSYPCKGISSYQFSIREAPAPTLEPESPSPPLRFPSPLIPGTLLKRYKRFLADVRLADGTVVTAHCPNPGAMTGYAEPGLAVRLSLSANPGRKLAHTLELVHNGACWIGVHAALANAVVEEALRAGAVRELAGYGEIRREVACGASSRVDFRLQGPAGPCWLEVKSVTWLGGDGCYGFPDAVTARGLRHLADLGDMAEAGQRAAVLFLIQRCDGGAGAFRAAAEVDPAYARGLAAARRRGVEVLPYLAKVGEEGITLEGPVPYLERLPP